MQCFYLVLFPSADLCLTTECVGVLGTAYTVPLRVRGCFARTMSGSFSPPVLLTGILQYLVHSWPSILSVE